MCRYNKDEYNEFLYNVFKGYKKRKAEGTLYSKNDFVPQNIINFYYGICDEPTFNLLVEKFKLKYIYNENMLESVSSSNEREGLNSVYDYIQNYKNKSNINLFNLLNIHQNLYSKVPYKEFGGKFRNEPAFLTNSDIQTEEWNNIPKRFSELYVRVNELVKKGLNLHNDKNSNELIEYINLCLKLKCELIKIHPFADGNGRSIRAFTNLLFTIANIPPVYVKNSERKEYLEAMHEAMAGNKFNKIEKFYYYKICDSIYELEFEPNLEKDKEKKLTLK